MLKILIITLLLLMMLVLGLSWRAMSSRSDPMRMNRLLWIRVLIAVAIIALLIFGGMSGHLQPNLPWQY